MVKKAHIVNEHFKNVKNMLETCSHESVHIYTQYRNDLKLLDKKELANSANPDQTALADQGPHCLTFH